MRPRRARLGLRAARPGRSIRCTSFNEAEARAPRIVPAYRPLGAQANSPRFRAAVLCAELKPAGFHA
jgi:hypothetical protein